MSDSPAYGCITQVPGLLAGHWTSPQRPTGCSVVIAPQGAVAAVDVRGAAPGTRETDLLAPGHLVDKVHAVMLGGGSAWGLDAASGVVRWLEQQGIGMDVGFGHPLPLVPAAVLFDLPVGDARIRPDADGGFAACAAAGNSLLACGGVDVLDIEWRACGPHRDALRSAARAAGAAALFSEHHFDGTPATEAMTAALTGMADAGADIAKLAVMPHTAADAARLLEATACAMAARPGTPLITMSMGPLGAVTRFCGGAFGSCATFGVTSGTAASAPGQPPADLLKAKLITAPL